MRNYFRLNAIFFSFPIPTTVLQAFLMETMMKASGEHEQLVLFFSFNYNKMFLKQLSDRK